MPHGNLRPTRRNFIAGVALGAAALSSAEMFAEELTRTPRLTEGPFYPNKLPLDTDNDLIVINDSLSSAVGEITHLSGRLLDERGNPIRGAVIEIWQVDHQGAYLHTHDPNHVRRDKNFQGYGRFLTGSTGDYYFRTIKPVSYPGRTPHIHVQIKRAGDTLLTTQCFIKGHADNGRDGVYRGLRDAKAREAVTVPFEPVRGSRIGELAARFDVVLGVTPEA